MRITDILSSRVLKATLIKEMGQTLNNIKRRIEMDLNIIDKKSVMNTKLEKQNDEVTLKDFISFATGAVAAWYLPKMIGSKWSSGINGVITSAAVTIVSGELVYMLTKNDRYKYSITLGGAVVTGFKALDLYYESYIPEKYKCENIRDERFETTVNELLNEQLTEYGRDTATTKEHLDEIKEIIQEDDIGTIEMRFGGSISRHTYVYGLSDVDILVNINKSELSEKSPHDIREYMKTKLTGSNSKNIDNIHVGKLAVTVTFTDGEKIQLLPAIRRGEGYKIQDQNNDSWSNVIRPDKFAAKLTEVNRNCNGKVIPVVKLVKGINTQFPEDQQLKGYHMESIAIEVFKSYPDSNPKTPKAMLRYFFEKAKDIVKSPIRDKTNQSLHVDDYLGQEESTERMRISYALDRIARKIKNADEIGSIDKWRGIYE